MKESGPAANWTEIDRFEGGIGWLAYPEETMERASHALAVDGDVWVIDPVDADGIDDLLAEFGEVAGVVVLLDRHKRDAETLARRHNVSVWVPAFIDGVAESIDAPERRFRGELADTGYALQQLVDSSLWQEAALYNQETGVLVVPEAVGTTSYFRTADEQLGVHPMLRMTPPEQLTEFRADHLLVGHGPGIHTDVSRTIQEAIEGSRRRTPRLVVKTISDLLFG